MFTAEFESKKLPTTAYATFLSFYLWKKKKTRNETDIALFTVVIIELKYLIYHSV